MLSKPNDLQIYIHIPFCVSKCRYCDFVSAPGTPEQIDAYVDALCKEIKVSGAEYKGRHITSIYMGGGTPSLLSNAQFEKIVNTLQETFGLVRQYGAKGPFSLDGKKSGNTINYLFNSAVKDLKYQIEFTVEINPESVNAEKYKKYKQLGVNRISIGMQAGTDKELEMLGRAHNSEQFIDAFFRARDAGMENINIDLLQAIPGQTLVSYMKSLYSLMMLGPDHISTYSLIVEKGTPFYEMSVRENENWKCLRLPDGEEIPYPSEDEDREIYKTSSEFLEKAGLSRYEISNFEKKDRECRHNIGYWQRTNYIGFGLNAASMIDNVRWKNTKDLEEYMSIFSKAGDGMPDLKLLRKEVEKLSVKEQMAEFMFLGLRMQKGVAKEEFMEAFGVDFDYQYGEITNKFIEDGFMQVQEFEYYNPETKSDYVKTRVSLTDKGIDVSNTIMAEYL